MFVLLFILVAIITYFIGLFAFSNIIGSIKNIKNYGIKIRLLTLSIWCIILAFYTFIVLRYYYNYRFAMYLVYIITFVLAFKADYSADKNQTNASLVKFKSFTYEEICELILSFIDEMFNKSNDCKIEHTIPNVAFAFSCFELLYIYCINPNKKSQKGLTAYMLNNISELDFFEYRLKYKDKIMNNPIFNTEVSLNEMLNVLSESSVEYFSSTGIKLNKYFFFDSYVKFSEKLVQYK